MAPNSRPNTTLPNPPTNQVKKSHRTEYKWNLRWRNVVIFSYLHVTAIRGFYYIFQAMYQTNILNAILLICGGLGITAGAHRLWAHKTYKAKLPLRIFLGICQTIAFQNSIYEWARDHRSHHKFTDTDADPHNASRGFFFSHIGWLMVRKHKDVKEKGKTVDMSDLEADSVVMFQKKHYLPIVFYMSIGLPIFISWYFWKESLSVAWIVCLTRYTVSLNATWSVNSVAHIWGKKPYDKSIKPTENVLVAIAAFGEGWHNFHHVFPWDYKAAEFGDYKLNATTGFIDAMESVGLASDLKTASVEMVKKRMKRTGDGPTQVNDNSDEHHHDDGEQIWGWGDKDMKKDEIADIKTYNQLKED